MADNEHPNIPDEQLHVPKGFEDASPGTHLTKDFNSQNSYDWMYWQNPILDFVDGASAPPTENLGDRYVILELSTSTEDAGWDGALFNDIVEFVDVDLDGTGDTWMPVTPLTGFFLYDIDTKRIWGFDSVWGYLTDSPTNRQVGYDEAVTSGGTAITFDTTLASTNYALAIRGFDSSGNPLAIRITNKATTGFTAKSPKNGFIDYIAIIK